MMLCYVDVVAVIVVYCSRYDTMPNEALEATSIKMEIESYRVKRKKNYVALYDCYCINFIVNFR